MIYKNKLVEIKEVSKTNVSFFDEKRLGKMFSVVSINASIEETLSKITKAELHDIRRALEIVGASSLKKSDLIKILGERIKSTIALIVNKLSEKEYKFLLTIVQNGGELKFEEKYLEEVITLRKWGVVVTSLTDKYEKYVFIPKELKSELGYLLTNQCDEVACTIDVQQAAPLTMSPKAITNIKIGRNAPCPCGSGKKYKRCCLQSRVSSIV